MYHDGEAHRLTACYTKHTCGIHVKLEPKPMFTMNVFKTTCCHTPNKQYAIAVASRKVQCMKQCMIKGPISMRLNRPGCPPNVKQYFIQRVNLCCNKQCNGRMTTVQVRKLKSPTGPPSKNRFPMSGCIGKQHTTNQGKRKKKKRKSHARNFNQKSNPRQNARAVNQRLNSLLRNKTDPVFGTVDRRTKVSVKALVQQVMFVSEGVAEKDDEDEIETLESLALADDIDDDVDEDDDGNDDDGDDDDNDDDDDDDEPRAADVRMVPTEEAKLDDGKNGGGEMSNNNGLVIPLPDITVQSAAIVNRNKDNESISITLSSKLAIASTSSSSTTHINLNQLHLATILLSSPSKHQHTHLTSVSNHRLVASDCYGNKCGSRITITSPKAMRKRIITRAFFFLRSAQGFNHVYNPATRNTLVRRRRNGKRYVVFVPFRTRYLREFL